MMRESSDEREIRELREALDHERQELERQRALVEQERLRATLAEMSARTAWSLGLRPLVIRG